MNVLIFNCWRHSIAFHLMKSGERKPLATGSVQRVTLGEGTITVRVCEREVYEAKIEYLNHGAAIKTVVSLLTGPYPVVPKPAKIHAIAHRVVHGGEMFHGSTLLNRSTASALRELTPLAPLHIPHNVAGIDATLELFPYIPQVAVFDTAFHQTFSGSIPLSLPYVGTKTKALGRTVFMAMPISSPCSVVRTSWKSVPPSATSSLPLPAGASRSAPSEMESPSIPAWGSRRWKGCRWEPGAVISIRG